MHKPNTGAWLKKLQKVLKNKLWLYADNADELLAHSQSEDEQQSVDITEQQRILEEENEEEEDGNASDTGTLTPGNGDKMEIDDTGSGAQLTGSKPDKYGDTLLKSRSPPTAGGIIPAQQPLPATRAAATATAESSKASSYASNSSGNTVASKPMGTGFNGNSPETNLTNFTEVDYTKKLSSPWENSSGAWCGTAIG